MVLSVACGVVVWHMVTGHNSGLHLDMFQWPETGRGYLTALYNLAVMLVLGGLLGALMDRLSSLVGRGQGETRPPGEEGADTSH